VARLLSTALKNSSQSTLDSHSYEYNAANQRTRQTFMAGNYVDYGYDGLGQLVSAMGKEAGGSSRLLEKFGYVYDPAGNLATRTNNALLQTFNVKNLNELTTVTRSGTLTVAGTTASAATSVTVNGNAATVYGDSTFAKDGLSLTDGTNTFTAVGQDSLGRADTNAVTVYLPATLSFTYDDNGNLLSDGRRAFGYDDENQLVTITVTNAWHSRFVYDGLGRRRVRMEASWVNSAWVTNTVVRYVYDGMLVIQERDANNVPLVTYTRGRDLSGGMQGAGGIGGLLTRTENGKLITGNASAAHAYFHADALGNVTCLVDGNQSVAARYHYDPYGNVLAKSGSLADANLYRFSSKEAHAASGLVYYGFRYYEPAFQRWINRDPIGERGGVNLYRSFLNTPVAFIDPLGLMDTSKWDYPCESKGGQAAKRYTEDELEYACQIAITGLCARLRQLHALQNKNRQAYIETEKGMRTIGRAGRTLGISRPVDDWEHSMHSYLLAVNGLRDIAMSPVDEATQVYVTYETIRQLDFLFWLQQWW
jgi:RHS repeat-associated protein